jgi:peptidoglycan hydrolase-like protein with peptidoglycan-binding domain
MPTKLPHSSVYHTAEEKERLQKSAKFYGLNVSKFLLLAGLEELPEPEDTRKLLFQLIFEIRRTGANLSQIRRNLNAVRLTGEVEPVTDAEVKQAVKEFQEVIKQIGEGL